MEKKILVVDDEKMILGMMEKALSREGYKVLTAGDAEKALDILKENTVHVMFLDLKLPGMNGIDLCKAIRKDNSMSIIYAVTGYASLFELSGCREAGFDDYFTKPVDLKVLFKAAKDAFDKIDRWKTK